MPAARMCPAKRLYDRRVRPPPFRAAVTVVLLVAGLAVHTGPAAFGAAKSPDPHTANPRHGELISAQKIPQSPAGASGYKVSYHSRSVAGADITVTGTVFVPPGTPPKGGWPVLSYAHETVGLADSCAPSAKIGTLQLTIAGAFSNLGVAVVQTDYEGLGTPGRHPYLVGTSEGRGVLDIVRAARRIPNESLSNRIVVWGHSQGGHAALFAGQLAKTWTPELQLLGVVAGAPPSTFTGLDSALESSRSKGYLFMYAAGLHAADPSLDLRAVLTTKAEALLPVVDRGCTAAVFAAFADTPLSELLTPAGLRSGPWAKALAASEPGAVRIPAPVLIVHGNQDEVIPVETSAGLMKKLCARKTVVERRVYPGQDHTGAALASLFDVIGWMQARIAGTPKPVNQC